MESEEKRQKNPGTEEARKGGVYMKRRKAVSFLLCICLAGAAVLISLGAISLGSAVRPSGKELHPKHMELSSDSSGGAESLPSEPQKPVPEPLASKPASGKTAYLTFDDGPTPKTPEVLQILKDKGVTATFFVVFHADSDTYYQQIADSGCQLAIHAYSHDYKSLYASNESYFADYYKMQAYLKRFTGTQITDFRFPGGSSQTVTDKKTFCGIILETQRRGLRYVDWNVSAGDATNRKIDAAYVYNNIIPSAFQYDQPVILMHERSPYTREALPKIIDALKEHGYQFGLVRDLTVPVQHRTPEYAQKVVGGEG